MDPAALQLVRQVNGSAYELCPAAVKQLQDLGDTPIAVVSIAGVAREGKSYILNRLTEAAGGFPVSKSVDPCTHGIWLWPSAIPVEGRDYQLLLLDSEGVATREQTSQASATMVALAGLVSSILICNQLGSFNEHCVENLCQAAAIMKGLFGSPGCSVADGRPVCAPPALLLLLRDFGLTFDDGREDHSSPTAHLEAILADIPLAGADVAGIRGKNAMRGVIKEVFQQRSCICLPRPAIETHNLEQQPDSALSPAFVQGVDTLRSQVFNACPKTFKGEWITGPLLVQLLTAAVEAANKPGGVLNIGSMWSAMLQAELKEATAAAEHVYKTATDALATAKTPEEAERCHKEAVLKAAAAFAEASRFADEHSRAGALASLDQQFNISFVGVLERIKRRLLEKQLDYDKLLDKAKSQGLEALDWEGLSQEVTACHDEKAALEAVEVHITAAWHAFDSILSTWPEEPLHGFEACTAAARRELEAAATAAKAMAVHAMQAALEAERADAAVEEREKLRMEVIMESQQLAALADSVQAYKQGINCHVRKGCSEPELRGEHEKLLTQIQSSLAAKMSDVTAERIAELNTDIHVQCEDILERCIAVVQERESSNARGRLVTAVTEASRAFKVSTRNITNSSSSENEARRICQDAKTDALQQYKTAAAKQSVYQLGSQEYDQALSTLLSEVDEWAEHLIDGVRRSIAYAGEMLKIKTDMEAALKEQKDKSDKALQSWIAEKQELVKQQEGQLALVKSQRSRADDGGMMSVLAAIIGQMGQLRVGYSSGSQGYPGRMIDYPQTASVYDMSEGGYLGSPSGRSRNAVPYGRGSMGITLKGTICKFCQKGRCSINHAQYT